MNSFYIEVDLKSIILSFRVLGQSQLEPSTNLSILALKVIEFIRVSNVNELGHNGHRLGILCMHVRGRDDIT